ncbi:hypothetical protein NDU88_012406 [Pleurodeles waltl]|uniref:Uncharacterized protein n=1 Tax=Pleurodeles waltl TaxID=8319 RepID=A0AAV7R1U5_PLEWA|nr:hypothetical protein NDU88_012406 [Pleurodeles waltl]
MNEDEACTEGESIRMIKSQTFVTLPYLHVHPIDAGLCAAPDDCTASDSPTSSIPCLITVEPTLPGRCPQEPSSEHLPGCRVDSEGRTGWTAEPTAELQGMLLKIPGNQKGEITGCPVGDKAGTSFSTSKRSDLKISRVAFANTNLPEHPKVLHSSSRRTLDPNAGGGLSKARDDDLVYLATKASPLIDVSSIETLHNTSETENSTGSLDCWDLRVKSVARATKIEQSKNEPENPAARRDKKESLCDSNVLLEELNARELCNQKPVNIKSNTRKKMAHSNMQNTPSISNKSSIKYSCNRIGVVHNQFLDSLCDKYINQSDEMKERICSNNALWKALMLDGFVYKKKGENTQTLRTINAAEGNGSRVQENKFDSRYRKPFAFRGDDPLCTPVKNLTVSRHSTEGYRFVQRTDHAHGSNLPEGCLVSPLRKKNKINLNENSLARFARKTYHSVFSSALGIPSCHNENTRVVCPEKSTQEEIQVRESPCPNSTAKESQSIAAEICKSSEDLSPYLKSPSKSQPKKSVHASSYKESDRFSPDSNELSVLANLHFCKLTGSPALNIPDSDETRNLGPGVVDGLVTFEPVLSNSGPQNIPPTREQLLTDNELAVINMLCTFKKSAQHPEELLS